MTDQPLMNAVALQLALLQTKIHALELMNVRNGLCSAEGMAAATEEALTENLGQIAQRTQIELVQLARAMEHDGLSFETVLQRLQARRDKWKDLSADK